MKMLPLEKAMKGAIQELLSDKRFEHEITEEVKESFDLYLSKDWQYFGNEQYFDKNLEVMYSAISNFYFVLSDRFFQLKKRLLAYQEELLEISGQQTGGFNQEVECVN